MGDMARILHVTECHDGGVSSAIRKLVDLTPEHEHYILLDGGDLDVSRATREVRMFRAKGMLKRTLEVRRAVADINPDYVHLHSSWAGAYGRITPLKAKTIYQPHCYKFDDSSLSPAKRWIYRAAEKVLSFRSDKTVVLSEHEARLTFELNATATCFYVPNVPSCEQVDEEMTSGAPEDGARRVLMVGRICEQKDPLFFGQVAKLAASSPVLSGFIFRWVGDGEHDLREALQDDGVEVAGWKQGNELLAELDAGDYYVHSAAYEGFPISILDAAARGLPIIGRSIDALIGSGAYLAESPEEVVDALERAEVQPEFQDALLDRSKLLLAARTDADQERAWLNLYSSSVEVTS